MKDQNENTYKNKTVGNNEFPTKGVKSAEKVQKIFHMFSQLGIIERFNRNESY